MSEQSRSGMDSSVPGDDIIVDAWSDVVCPYCYLGETALEIALADFPQRSRVTVRRHSFLLLPQVTSADPVPLFDFIASATGTTREAAAGVYDAVEQRGREYGLRYRFDLAQVVDSRPAHRLRRHAQDHGADQAVLQRLFQSYFVEGANIADALVLRRVAQDSGLDPDEAERALTDPGIARAVTEDVERAARLGITGVPYFVFGGRYALSGAQPVEAFRYALESATGVH